MNLRIFWRGAAMIAGAIMVAGPAIVRASPAATQADSQRLPCRDNDKPCIASAALNSPVRQRAFWKMAFDKPVIERFGTAPTELSVFLNLENLKDGVPNRPRAVEIPPDLLKDVKAAMADIPAPVWKLLENRLAGIYFVKDLGGTAYCDYADSGGNGAPAGWIALDMDVLAKRTANEWATWKENTPFKPADGYRLDAVIETSSNDNRKNAIRYILLHEIGHVLSIGTKLHPRWDRPPAALDAYSFAHGSWQWVPRTQGYASRFDDQFSLRRDVRYYFGAKLSLAQARDVYAGLASTNFPSLYAATSPGDDFAESFATFVHSVVQKRPWEIRLYRHGKLLESRGTCWDEKRCSEKRRLLEDLMQHRCRP